MWETTSAGKSGFSDGNATDIGMGAIDAMNFRAGRAARAAASYSPPSSGGSGGSEIGGVAALILIGFLAVCFFSGSGKQPDGGKSAPARSSQSDQTGVVESNDKTTKVEISSVADHTLVFYSDTRKIALSASGRNFVLNGVEALITSRATTYTESAGFVKLREVISRADASIECDPVDDTSYKCFLVSRDGTHQRKDIAKYAINVGAAKTTAYSVKDYKDLETKARAAGKGNWGSA